jgi:hypothetical protein
VIAPAEPYLLGAGYLLDGGLLLLAEAALARAAACLSEQDVPKVRGGHVSTKCQPSCCLTAVVYVVPVDAVTSPSSVSSLSLSSLSSSPLSSSLLLL